MSAISSIGISTPTSSQPLQTSPDNQPSQSATSAMSQTKQSAGNDPDHDGDNDGRGINTTA
jgi:hypothetical protein